MFEHLSQLQIAPNATAWLELPDVSPKARICLKHAGEPNKPYFNALLSVTAPEMKKRGKAKLIDFGAIGRNRATDQDLYSNYIITGWEGIQTRGEDGEWVDVPFNRKNALEFCQKAPEWIFDQLREFAGDLSNYLPEGHAPTPDPDDISPN